MSEPPHESTLLPPAPAQDQSAALDQLPALTEYKRRLRRGRAVYFTVVAVIVAALVAFSAVAWSRGEAAHVTLHVAPSPAASLPLGDPAATAQLAWRSSDRLALGTPQYGGAVVSWSAHTVRGRDARTGKVLWSYTRTDRTMCTAVQLNGTTIAVFSLHGNCDQLNALASDTGQRRWSRTLDEDGMPLNGTPAYQWTDSTLMLTTSSVIYAVDPGSGLDRWTYTRYGCRIERAVLGPAGALISQDCARPDCSQLDRCGAGPQLVLRDGAAGRDDVGKRGRDHFLWNDIGNDDIPVSAGAVISAVNPAARALREYRASDGRRTAEVALVGTPPSVSAANTSVAVDATDGQLIWLGGVTYSLAAAQSEPVWSLATAAAPTVSAADDQAVDLAHGRVTVPTSTGVAVLNGQTGRVSNPVALSPAPAQSSRAYPLGDGFLVGSAQGISAYQ